MDQFSKFAICLIVVTVLGCEMASTNPGAPSLAQGSSADIATEMTKLSEQNAELIQMLEEAEDKVVKTLADLELSQSELNSQGERIKALEAQRDEAFARLSQAGNLIDDFRLRLQNFTSEAAQQLDQFDALFPENDASNSTQNDQSQMLAPEPKRDEKTNASDG